MSSSKEQPQNVAKCVENAPGRKRALSGGASNEEIITASGQLERNISIRQMVFMALGGSIGAGFLVSSGAALKSGGPVSLVLTFALVGAGVGCTMGCLGELAASYPVAGAFYVYSTRMISDAWGFAVGWNYMISWLIVFPFELTTIAAQMKYWVPDLNPAYVIAPLLVGLTATSFLGSRWYGEIEHAFGVGKAIAITVFIFVAVFIIAGAVPSDPRQGTGIEYWKDPGPFNNGASGFFLVFRTAGISYGGTELLGLTAAECKRPQKALPLATKIVFARIAFFYILALIFLGLVIPSNHKDLALTGHGAKYSPFTLAAEIANIECLPSFLNALIVSAIISMANASLYASSRAFHALCEMRMGPRWGRKLWRGVPVNAFIVSFFVGLLAFVNMAPGGGAMFDWLLSLSGASNYYTWASICISYIRFHRARVVQERREPLLWRSPFGVIGAYVGLSICVIGLLANVVTAISPIAGRHSLIWAVRDNIGTVIPPLLYAGYRGYERWILRDKRPTFIPPNQVDLQADLRVIANKSGADEEQPGVVHRIGK
ncbi:amino acid permease [Colletotrichum sojae]|uniref:Amino acid permease n=1 Tax=Colletotrichum sojae TaxID=2175907 RepID=A0A8H6JUU8_9PEZI|nr:amino acid permease [Colletotrichum sojae]